ncbi:MAG: hypothetical protein IKP21_05495 [Bacteroidales bacterium]|nr:hypothetical protein [Bacteroidales bacterium]
MIRRWAIALAIVAVGLLAAAWVGTPRTVPFDECSTLYRHYYGTEGVEVAFIRGLPIDDSVAVDVTQIVATDTTAWRRLAEDFGMPKKPAGVTGKGKAVAMILTDKEQPAKHSGLAEGECDLTLLSDEMRCITVFHINNKEEMDHILYRELYKMQNPSARKPLVQ